MNKIEGSVEQPFDLLKLFPCHMLYSNFHWGILWVFCARYDDCASLCCLFLTAQLASLDEAVLSSDGSLVRFEHTSLDSFSQTVRCGRAPDTCGHIR